MDAEMAMKQQQRVFHDMWMHLKRHNRRAMDLLERAAECLNNYADVRDGDGGRPQPNAAMSLESEITEFLREVRK